MAGGFICKQKVKEFGYQIDYCIRKLFLDVLDKNMESE